ncbi:hypothetical protein GCM10023211_08860 [Orbus sasakiae]|uniref:GYF domain-containing protein n=1 Tax=Orbus sasakiae TaxID=1078475 RepID=A0ABP9N6G9_9GAMM
MDNLENKQWFYELSGKRIGPVSENGMIALIKTNVIGYGNVVWRSNYPDWINLEDSELKEHLSTMAPPPLTGKNVNNTVVWLLAFAPIISVFIVMIILAFQYKGNEYRMLNAYYNGEFWWIAIIVNILLSIVDENILKKSGNDTSKFKGWVWLVPVYLFQRAKFLKQNQAYFWVWIVTFVITLLW